MRKLILLAMVALALSNRSNAQEISPYLFGQNHWIAQGDEGTRVGYLHLLWPKVKESGIKSGRIEKQSSMMFIFNAQGALLKQISYGLAHNLKNQAPEVEEIEYDK